MKDAIKTKLQDCETVSVTADIWSDRRMSSFLGITAHALLEKQGLLKMQSYTLACERFLGKHTVANTVSHFEQVMEEYGIKQKIEYIIIDNASNMKKAFNVCFGENDDEDDSDEICGSAIVSERDDIDGSAKICPEFTEL